MKYSNGTQKYFLISSPTRAISFEGFNDLESVAEHCLMQKDAGMITSDELKVRLIKFNDRIEKVIKALKESEYYSLGYNSGFKNTGQENPCDPLFMKNLFEKWEMGFIDGCEAAKGR